MHAHTKIRPESFSKLNKYMTMQVFPYTEGLVINIHISYIANLKKKMVLDMQTHGLINMNIIGNPHYNSNV